MRRSVMFFVLLIGIGIKGYCQSHNITVSIPKVSLISIAGGDKDHADFFLLSPGEAGHTLNPDKNKISGWWLNYSSNSAKKHSGQKIVATLSQDIPPAYSLFIEVSAYSGQGKGKFGVPGGKQHLSRQPVEIISNIGNCYTGRGINNGHLLTYFLEVNEDYFDSIHSGKEENILVIYTISD